MSAANGDGRPPTRPPRTPTTWPTAALGAVALLFLGWVAFLCSGVATDWIAR